MTEIMRRESGYSYAKSRVAEPSASSVALEDPPVSEVQRRIQSFIAAALILYSISWWVPATLARFGIPYSLVLFNAIEFLSLLPALLAFGSVVLNWNDIHVQHRRRVTALWQVLCLLPGALLLAALVRQDTGAILEALLQLGLVLGLAAARTGQVFRVLRVTLMFACLVSLALPFASTNFLVMDRSFIPLIFDGRYVGVFAHANNFGFAGAVLAIMSLGNKEVVSRVGLIIGIVSVAASASQTSLAGLALALALYVVTRSLKLGNRVRLYRGLGVVVFTAAVAAMVILISQATESISQTELRLTGRVDIWRALLEYPPGFYGQSEEQFEEVIHSVELVNSAHNLFFEYWARAGVLGLVASVVFIGALIARSFAHMSALSISGAAYVVVSSLTEGVFFMTPYLPYIAMLVAWTLLANDEVRAELGRSDG